MRFSVVTAVRDVECPPSGHELARGDRVHEPERALLRVSGADDRHIGNRVRPEVLGSRQPEAYALRAASMALLGNHGPARTRKDERLRGRHLGRASRPLKPVNVGLYSALAKPTGTNTAARDMRLGTDGSGLRARAETNDEQVLDNAHSSKLGARRPNEASACSRMPHGQTTNGECRGLLGHRPLSIPPAAASREVDTPGPPRKFSALAADPHLRSRFPSRVKPLVRPLTQTLGPSKTA